MYSDALVSVYIRGRPWQKIDSPLGAGTGLCIKIKANRETILQCKLQFPESMETRIWARSSRRPKAATTSTWRRRVKISLR